MVKRIALGLGLLVLVLVAGFILWASAVNPILPAAQQALVSGKGVVVESGDWISFTPDGQRPETGLIFYPGGKVDFRAYAPFARAVAERGYRVVIVRVPLNLAVFNPGIAGEVMDAYPEVRLWAVGGHSLGGSMAANFAAQNYDRVDGLLLLASYPASSDDISGADLPVVSVYGSKDGLATGSQIEASRALLPASTRFIEIPGGNHAQFGDYGLQQGDQEAEISRAEQQAITVTAAAELLESLGGK